ncbi:MAG: FeoC-like transcriptional regulator [Proteobacteria bacterium]|nr:FeoC-like transcriptional regulator [Pseudomonadota bacterium]
MILLELRDYLKTVKRAALPDLATHFDTDAGVLRDLLRRWEKRGDVLKLDAISPKCGSCQACGAADLEIYIWNQNHPSAM